jgi:2-dehydro-3-deoxyphosphooctonate aldolase (KDO 8-P synthase)
MRKVHVGSVVFGDPKTLPLIAGPCVIESELSTLKHAERILKIARELKMPYIFKSSYDKANRTSVRSYRGPGLAKGLRILAKIKDTFKIPVLSDVHREEEIAPASEVLDILQIPAFLCRQTDLLVTAGRTKRVINLKKGQFLSPWDIQHAIQKIQSAGNENILITERGTCFGYNNLVSDFRAIPIVQKFGFPVIFDATHSVQIPGGKGDASGGNPEFIPILARCAVASGINGIFLEVHENPARALSDGPNSIALHNLKSLLRSLLAVHGALRKVKVQ